jgi:sugar lactone lactonase YvrE
MDVYEANDWLGAGMLNIYSTIVPDFETSRVVNNSWIGNFGQVALGVDSIRRLDYAIERDGYVNVAAVNNGSGTTIPQLLGNSYNSIVVGLTNGNSSLGGSTLDVTGRSVIGISVPETFTSNASPVVAAAAAMLVEAATDAGDVHAQKSEMIKAFLLGGATKTEFDLTGSTPSTLDDWTHTSTQPLDLRHGAGELNVFNSYNLFAAGEQEGGSGTLVKTTGWDFDTIGAGGQNDYYFNILDGQTATELSIFSTWNRHITATPNGGNPMNLSSTMANVNLRLYEVGGGLVAQSVSTIDNVELLYLPTLEAGSYRIEVDSNLEWDVALTWQTTLTGNAFLSIAAVDSAKVTNFDTLGTQSLYADDANGLQRPIDVTHDDAGNRYVADAVLSRIVKIDASGNSTIFADSGDGVFLPTSVAMSGDGFLYVANYLTNQIIRLDSLGNGTVFSDTADGLERPFGVAVDANGTVFVAEADTRRILMLDSLGNATVFADEGDGLVSPLALAFAPNGDLYVVDVTMSRILRFDSNGVATIFADINDGLFLPSGLAFDADGNLYVSNYTNNRIYRFDSLGNGTLFAEDPTLSGLFGIDIIDELSSFEASSANFVDGFGVESGVGNSGQIATVPEGGTFILTATGCLLLGLLRRRR